MQSRGRVEREMQKLPAGRTGNEILGLRHAPDMLTHGQRYRMEKAILGQERQEVTGWAGTGSHTAWTRFPEQSGGGGGGVFERRLDRAARLGGRMIDFPYVATQEE